MNGRPEQRPETSRRCYLWKFSHVNPTEPLWDSRHVKREAVCTTILITDEKWPQTEHQQSIDVSLTFEPQSYSTLFFHPAIFEQRLCLHWTINRGARGRLKEGKIKTSSLSEIDTWKAAYHWQSQLFFSLQENVRLQHLLGIQPKLILSVGENNISNMSLASKNGAWDFYDFAPKC